MRRIMRGENMKTLIPKPELRRLELIQLLNSEKRDLTTTEIASLLDCNERIIKEDISKINRDKSGHFKIYTQGDKVRIEFKKNIGIDYVIQSMMKNTLAFRIVEKSFFSENLSLEQAAEKLFLSPSSLYRYINLINAVMKKDFNLKIVTYPFQIVGDEEVIRYFYLQYFLERYLIGDWPFEHIIPEEYAEAVLKSRIEKTNFKISLYKYHQLKYLLAIKLIRIKKGFRLNIKDADLTLYEDMVEEFNNSFYNRAVGVKYTPDILIELSDCLIHSSFQFSFSEYITKVNEDAEYNRIFLKLYKIISILNNEYDINPIVKDMLIFNLHTTYLNGINEVDASYILHDSKEKFVQDLKISYRPFFNRAEELFKEFLLSTKNTVDDYLLRQLIYTLFTKWEGLTKDLLGTIKHIRVLVISKYDWGHANLIKEFMGLEHWKEPNLIITLMDDGAITSLDTAALKDRFDIIIGNFSLTTNDELNFIRVNDMPTFRDFRIVYGEINKLLTIPIEEEVDEEVV